MASTYTANNGIEKPGSGEQAGSWGTTTNRNFDIIDRALNGVGEITLSGTSHTLTTTDGATSDGQYKVLIMKGSITATNTVTISPNNLKKLYFVNNTTSHSVIFNQGSTSGAGTKITVAAGSQAIIYVDGGGTDANVVEVKPAAGSVGTGQIDTAQLAAGAVETAKINDDAVTQAKLDMDVQTKSGTASVTMSSTAVTTYVKHSGTGTLTIGDGEYDGQTINITSTGTMTLSWSTGSQGVSLGSDAKIASGIWDDTASYWFFSETVT